MLNGKKTNLSALAMVISAVLFYFNVVDMNGFMALVGTFLGTGIYGLRDKLERE